MRPEDMSCASCEKPLIGRGVLLVPHEDEESPTSPEEEQSPMLLHPTCYIDIFNAVFQQEGTTMFEVYIGHVYDLWAGLYTESDEEAGL